MTGGFSYRDHDSIPCSPSSSTSSATSSSNYFQEKSPSTDNLTNPGNHVSVSNSTNTHSHHASHIDSTFPSGSRLISPTYSTVEATESHCPPFHVTEIDRCGKMNAHSSGSRNNYNRSLIGSNKRKQESSSYKKKDTKRPLLSCSVCYADTHYSFYGSVSCDPCRTFFRRQVLNGRTLECLQNQQCSVDGSNRKSCGWCRFQKCLAVGMRVEMVEQDVIKNRSTAKKIVDDIDLEIRKDGIGGNENAFQFDNNSQKVENLSHHRTLSWNCHPTQSVQNSGLPFNSCSNEALQNVLPICNHSVIDSKSRSFPHQSSRSPTNTISPTSQSLIPYHAVNSDSNLNSTSTQPSTLFWSSSFPQFHGRNHKDYQGHFVKDEECLSFRSLHKYNEDCSNTFTDYSSRTPPKKRLRLEESSSYNKPHPYLYLRRPKESQIVYRVLDVTGIPCVIYKTIIEVSVKDGVVLGTDCLLTDLLSKGGTQTILPIASEGQVDLLNFIVDKDSLLLDDDISGSRFQFTRSNERVFLEDVSPKSTPTQVILENMSEEHWCRLSQVVSSHQHFRDIMTVKYSLHDKERFSQELTKENHEECCLESKKNILLTVSIDSFMKFITRAFQSIDSFRSLAQVDQLLLIKDCVVEISYLHALHTFDQESQSLVWRAFGGNLLFCVTVDVFLNEPLKSEALYSSFRSLASDTMEYLRMDPIVISLLSILLLYKDDSYMSCRKVAQRERKLYVELLDKYIRGRVNSGDWKDVTPQIIWDHIHAKLDHIREIRTLYENLSLLEPKTREDDTSFKVLGDVLEYIIDLEGVASPPAIPSAECCMAYSASQYGCNSRSNNHNQSKNDPHYHGNNHGNINHSFSSTHCKAGTDGTYDGEPTHYWLSTRLTHNSNLEYRVLDIVGIACVSYKITIEVSVLNGIICNTTCNFQDLIEYNQSPKIIPQIGNSRLILNNAIDRKGQQIFHAKWRSKLTETGKRTADILVANSLTGKMITMDFVPEILWNRLSQVIEQSPLLHEVMHVRYGYPSTSSTSGKAIDSTIPECIGSSSYSLPDSSTHEIVKRPLLLTVGLDTVSKPIYQTFQAFEAFQSLPESDQFILMKECIMEVCFLHTAVTYDKKAESFIFPCLQDKLHFVVHVNVLNTHPTSQPLFHAFCKLVEDFDDVLRQDALVVNILCCLCVFKDRSGVTSSDVIQRERSLYIDLLDRYIKAKVRGREWKNVTCDSMWNQIHRKMAQVASIKSLFENLSLDALDPEQEIETHGIFNH